jgi:hypothetical protein
MSVSVRACRNIQEVVEISEVTEVAMDLFRRNGYLSFQVVYEVILLQFGSSVFSRTAFCRDVDQILWEMNATPTLISRILKSWFEDRALTHAGFDHLVD